MKEADFQKQVIDLARTCGWKVAHFTAAQNANGNWRTPVQADGKGFPDLFMIKKPHVMLVELKSDTGRLTKEQNEWQDILHASSFGYEGDDGKRIFTFTTWVWRPKDWLQIVKVLR